MTPNGPPQVFDVQSELTNELVTHRNVKQELVITTVDKLKLCLIEYRGHLRSRREWIGPAGLLIALITTLVAADFKDSALGLSAATWEALFLLCAIATGILTAGLAVRAIRTLQHGGIDSLIDRIADRSAQEVESDVYSSLLADWLAASHKLSITDLLDSTSEPTDDEDAS